MQHGQAIRHQHGPFDIILCGENKLNERYMDNLKEIYTANFEAPEKDEKW